jgi:hypothetical protein
VVCGCWTVFGSMHCRVVICGSFGQCSCPGEGCAVVRRVSSQCVLLCWGRQCCVVLVWRGLHRLAGRSLRGVVVPAYAPVRLRCVPQLAFTWSTSKLCSLSLFCADGWCGFCQTQQCLLALVWGELRLTALTSLCGCLVAKQQCPVSCLIFPFLLAAMLLLSWMVVTFV